MAFNLSEIVEKLIDIGFYQIFLPFLLVYAVVFAILQKSKIFEGGSSTPDQARKVNAIVAFVFGLFVVASAHIVSIFQEIIQSFIVIVIFILCVLIVLGFIFGDSFNDLFKDSKIKYSLASLILIVSLGILFNVLGWWDTISNFFDDSFWDSFGVVIGILIFGGILYWITSSDSKK